MTQQNLIAGDLVCLHQSVTKASCVVFGENSNLRFRVIGAKDIGLYLGTQNFMSDYLVAAQVWEDVVLFGEEKIRISSGMLVKVKENG